MGNCLQQPGKNIHHVSRQVLEKSGIFCFKRPYEYDPRRRSVPIETMVVFSKYQSYLYYH